MEFVIRAAATLLGIFHILVGARFLIDPVTAGVEFGLDARGNLGLSSLRADFTAIFWVTGGALLIAGLRKRGEFALVAVALMGTIFVLRGVSLVVDGPYTNWWVPMIVEAVTVALALAAAFLMKPAKS